jgi:hypothetical protein
VLAHSAAGLLLRDAAFACAGAGAVLLASALNAEYVQHAAPNTEDWDRRGARALEGGAILIDSFWSTAGQPKWMRFFFALLGNPNGCLSVFVLLGN